MTSNTLTIRWSVGERSFEPADAPVSIGRDSQCTIRVDLPSISRVHAELRHDGGGWSFVDLASTQGSRRDGAKVTTVTLDQPVSLVLGNPAAGERIELIPPVDARTEIVDPTRSAVPATELPVSAPGAARPGGDLRDEQLVGATVVTGEVLNLSCAGISRSLSPADTVTIGRDPGCDIVSTNPTVSREHARIRYSGTSWWLDDLQSSSGTFLDGRRVTTVALAGNMAIWLGEIDSGERVVIATGGERHLSAAQKLERASRSRNGVILGVVAVVAVLALAAGAFAVWNGTRSPDNSELASSAVRIVLDDGGSGSGTIIDAERGLILTNAHVVNPQAPGQALAAQKPANKLDPDPSTITLAVAPGLGKAAEPRFTAKVVAADGYLDLAIVKITNTISGSVVQKQDLESLHEIEIGDSDDINTGDAIRVVGFPAASESLEASFSGGVVSGSVQDQRLSSNRAFLNTDADINPGNSGGTAVDEDGRMIGVPTLGRLDKASLAKVGSMRPINFARDLIEAARNDKPYVSKYVQPLNGGENISGLTVVAPVSTAGFGLGCTAGKASVDASAKSVAFSFDYEGFTKDTHQDVLVGVLDSATGDLVGATDTSSQFPFRWQDKGCGNVTVPLTGQLAPGRSYEAAVLVGPNYELDMSRNSPNATFTIAE